MGHSTQVFGQISIPSGAVDTALETIQHFAFDEVYPFTNIFWSASPAQYLHGGQMIVFGGAFKQLEEEWDIWSQRFCQLINEMNAGEADVILKCLLGEFRWQLRHRSLANQLQTILWPENEELLAEYIRAMNENNGILRSVVAPFFPR